MYFWLGWLCRSCYSSHGSPGLWVQFYLCIAYVWINGWYCSIGCRFTCTNLSVGIARRLGYLFDWLSLLHLFVAKASHSPVNVMTQLEANNLIFSVDGCSVLNNISLSVTSGEWLGIAGLNGSGKSTLLKLMAGLLVPTSGQMSIDGKSYSAVNHIHRKLSIMSQRTDVLTAMSVLDLVRLGRYPHLPVWSFSLSSIDHERVEYALEFTGLNDLRNRQVNTLLGVKDKGPSWHYPWRRMVPVCSLMSPPTIWILWHRSDFVSTAAPHRPRESGCVCSS